MLDQPRTNIIARLLPSTERLAISGPSSEDAFRWIEHWFQNQADDLKSELSIESAAELPIELLIRSAPPRHSGFGSGTQLALSLAAATSKLLGRPAQSPEELAATLSRGKRSAIGTYGFCKGGFLVDRGKLENETLSPLDFRADFPEPWPVVLVRLKAVEGFSGNQELDAFKKLPPSDENHRAHMIELVRSEIIPGVLQKNYNQFGEAIFEFGRRSGEMFELIQGGPYHSEPVASLVNLIREFGIKAVGQSSWGPCVFAITNNDKKAAELEAYLKQKFQSDVEISITKADNTGAKFSAT